MPGENTEDKECFVYLPKKANICKNVMLFGFLSRMTSYLKATEKGVFKTTKDTFINISKIVHFF